MATPQLALVLRHIHRLAAGRCSPQRTDRQLVDDFSTNGDETAFAALVARHGPMVLRVCRRVLHHEQDAEDAFQATFLVLARSSGSIRKREALAEWLHGVAHRTAMKAKRSAVRRRIHEARLRAGTEEAVTRPSWDDVQAVLDEEIQRLPESYRVAFVLCLLEGKSGPEAAKELGVKEGTVRSRLNRARQRLQQQLARRGIELSVLLAAVSIADSGGKAGVPAELVRVTVHSGLLVAAGGTAAGVIPSHVATLAAGVTRAMLLTKTKMVTAIFLMVSLVVGGTGVLTHQVLAGKPQGPRGNSEAAGNPLRKRIAMMESPKPQATPTQEQAQDAVAFRGRVVGPSGQPVAGAKLYLTPLHGNTFRPSPSPEYGTTGTEGRFEFKVPNAVFHGGPAIVAATAPNYGAGWVNVLRGGKRDDLTLRLVDDDMPITGQIVDLEGKPVAGATLSVLQIKAAPRDDLGPWLQAVHSPIKGFERLSGNLELKYFSWFTIGPSKVTTDGQGRFRLTGIGRNRLVQVQLEGTGLATLDLQILTRPEKTIKAIEDEEHGVPLTFAIYYGANFRHVAIPTRPVVGVVRDKDTKKPLQGAIIVSSNHFSSEDGEFVRTTTDDQGCYRLTGMPKGTGNKVLIVPPADLPYPRIMANVPDSPGLDPVTLDIELKRGVWIEGKITDKVTGKPAQGDVGVEFRPLESNPNVRHYVGFTGIPFHFGKVNEDGTYKVVGLRGPGLVAVYCQTHRYLGFTNRDDAYGMKEATAKSDSNVQRIVGSNCGAVAQIEPATGTALVKQDLTLAPGLKLTGTVIGPDGKPLAGTRNFLLVGHWWDHEATRTAEFSVWLNPRGKKEIYFLHLEKGLVGKVQPPKESGESVTVRMEPGAAVTGRLVGGDGKPRAGIELRVMFKPKGWGDWFEYFLEPIKTDPEGRFRIEALQPGSTFRLSDGNRELPLDVAGGSAQTKDLGDVRLKRGKRIDSPANSWTDSRSSCHYL
jgi:RNA polymerase sigma factor (sigma-70 family)